MCRCQMFNLHKSVEVTWLKKKVLIWVGIYSFFDAKRWLLSVKKYVISRSRYPYLVKCCLLIPMTGLAVKYLQAHSTHFYVKGSKFQTAYNDLNYIKHEGVPWFRVKLISEDQRFKVILIHLVCRIMSTPMVFDDNGLWY